MNLNSGQQIAKDEIISWLWSDSRYWFLTADAGCGKSFLVAEILLHLVREKGWLQSQILVTAPSHRAKRVCRKFLDNAGLFEIPALTIHSALGLRLKRNLETGGTYLKKQDRKDSPLLGVKFLICDEISMYGEDIVQTLAIQSHNYGFKTLLVGDLKQLPPIGFNDFPIMRFNQQNKNISTLTEVMRYSDEHIGKCCDASKIAVELKSNFSPSNFIPSDSSVFKQTTENKAEMEILTLLKKRQDAVVLAFKNASVRSWNKRLRNGLFVDCFDESTLPPFLVGEKLICNTPVWSLYHEKGNDVATFQTGDELIIRNISQESVNFLNDVFERYILTVESEDCESNISVISPEHLDRFESLIKKQKNIHKKMERGQEKNKLGSILYESVPAINSQVNYTYAMTIHKSQGSSFDHVFLIDDIRIRDNRHDKKEEFAWQQPRLWYVGMSRAKKTLTIIPE